MSEQHKDNVIADLHEQVKGWRETATEGAATIESLREALRRIERGEWVATAPSKPSLRECTDTPQSIARAALRAEPARGHPTEPDQGG